MKLKLFLIIILMTAILVPIARAQEKGATQTAIIAYDLAFPGILPDNQLYKLKVLRDKIQVFFIFDQKKKIEFYLRKTDKEILATAMLVEKNQIKLAGETALKAEHNYTLLVSELLRLPRKPNSAFFQKLKTAALKHQEVLNDLLKKIPENEQKIFREVLAFSQTNLKTVEKFQRKEIFVK